MTQVTVELKYLRHAPRKVRRVIDAVRGKDVDLALAELAHLPVRAAHPVRKLLVSAVAAAKAKELPEHDLVIASISCDQGSALKRRRMNSRGRASLVKKLTSHVKMTVTDKAKKRGS